LELLNSPGFLENIGDRGIRTEDEARGYIVERMIGSYREHGFGMWLTVQKLDKRPVGLAGLVRREGLDVPDVGYAFAPRAWGQGYAQEAAAAVLAHALGPLGIPKLAAITSPENFASMAVLRKIGFTFQGMIELPGIERESTYFTAP
jgi:RimJ/RimL family protein N-acetyltransferase